MRKLKLQVQMTIDGFIAGEQGEMDWLTFNWGEDIKDYVRGLTENVDTILLGRNLAQGFIPHWTASLNSPTPDEGAETFVHTPKVVFTKTMVESIWDNTTLAKGELKKEIEALKSMPGKEMIVYGGGKFVSSLMKERLIDELHFFINPAIIGKGMPIFKEVEGKQDFTLIGSKAFECGIIVLTYKTNS